MSESAIIDVGTSRITATDRIERPARAARLDLRALVLPLVALLAWTGISAAGLVNPLKLPAPWTVAVTAWTLFLSGDFWVGLGYSLFRAVTGFSAAAIIGLVIGIILGVSRVADRLATPSFNAFRQIAPFAWIPLISAWTGATGEGTKIAFIVVASVAPIAISTFDGVRAVTREHIELARVLEIRRWRFIRGIVFPAALPQVLTGVHLSLVSAWLATIGAEYFLQVAPGITYVLQTGRAGLRMDIIIVAVAVIGVIGFGFSSIVSAVEHRVLRWRPTTRKF